MAMDKNEKRFNNSIVVIWIWLIRDFILNMVILNYVSHRYISKGIALLDTENSVLSIFR